MVQQQRELIGSMHSPEFSCLPEKTVRFSKKFENPDFFITFGNW